VSCYVDQMVQWLPEKQGASEQLLDLRDVPCNATYLYGFGVCRGLNRPVPS
jgi:hypothetical protein